MFAADSVAAMAVRIMHDDPDLGELTGPLRDLAARCLAKDPQQRPGSSEVLRALLGDTPGERPCPTGHGRPARRVRGRRIVRYEQSCHGQGATFARLAIGDGATRATRVEHQSSAPITATENAVAVRQGSVIAVYWDMRNNGPKLASISDHERDARKMAARLRGLGYHG